MDRSSMHKVESTYDVEKRRAFKAKLVDKLNAQEKQVKALSPDPVFTVGQRVWHPDLGACKILSVDAKTIEVETELNGDVLSMSLRHVQSKLGPVVEKKLVKEEPIGEIINRDLKPMLGDASLARDPRNVVRPVEPNSLPSFLKTGSSVWHPEIGFCLIHTMDEKANSIVLRSNNQDREFDLVLSQVRSKLVEATAAPEHVPMKPLVQDTIGKKVPAYSSHKEVLAVIPESFKSWRQQEQFHYLSQNQHLTTEQINDVFAVIEGKNPSIHAVKIEWVKTEPVAWQALSKEPTMASKKDYSHLYNKRFWHPDFGACTVASVEGNSLFLKTSVGFVPFVLDVTLPVLVAMEDSAEAEHSPKRIDEWGVKGRS